MPRGKQPPPPPSRSRPKPPPPPRDALDEADFSDRQTVLAKLDPDVLPLTRAELDVIRRTPAIDLTWKRLFRKLLRRPLLWVLRKLR